MSAFYVWNPYIPKDSNIVECVVRNKYPQLHISLGEFDDDFYRQGAPYAGRVLQVCQQHGGTLNFSERRK